MKRIFSHSALTLLIVWFCLAGMVSCKKDPPNPDKYLIFGHFFGECLGERCVEIYKLESNRLLEDCRDMYPTANTFHQGYFTPLDHDHFLAASELWSAVPPELLSDTITRFGEPDAVDQGGIYVEYRNGTFQRHWFFDMRREAVPERYHAFTDRIKTVIGKLP